MLETFMRLQNLDLHGNAPDKSAVALLLIDVINDLEFETGARLLPYALPMARSLSALKQTAVSAGVPVIYVNDNFGRWRSDFQAQVQHCLKDNVRGQAIVELLEPSIDDYFVLKPKHSGFFSTTLDLLLRYLEVDSLIITGMVTNVCVLFTANDAYMRDFSIAVPSDCVAGPSWTEHVNALEQMRLVLKADVRPSPELLFSTTGFKSP